MSDLVKLLCSVVLHALTRGNALYLSANKAVYSAYRHLSRAYITGILPSWKEDFSNYVTKGVVVYLLIVKVRSNQVPAFSVYSGFAGDLLQEHLVLGTTGFEYVSQFSVVGVAESNGG